METKLGLFNEKRDRLNRILSRYAGRNMKSFMDLDWRTYSGGAVPEKYKELMGLVSSLVLRCDDCISYHIAQCLKLGVTNGEFEETLMIGLIVGGSITIPHIRRAVETWDEHVSPKRKLLESLEPEVLKILDGEESPTVKMQKISDLLHEKVPHYGWFGFYLTDKNDDKMLVLGPFAGEPTEHTHIPFGKGICGQAAQTMKTFTIDDVSKESNYLSCSIKVKSEIVLPIVRNGKVLGELDIDSHETSAFDAIDESFLSSICERLSSLL